MQILGINSSPRRKSNTARLLTAVIEGAEDRGCNSAEISLSDYEIRFCHGCEACYRTGSCVQTDDFSDILEMIIESDAIILGSPNYINNVNAPMKALLDRMGDIIHCQRLLGRFCGAVSTAGGSGASDVASYLNQAMFLMGADVVGQVSANMADGEEAFVKAVGEGYDLGQRLAELVKKKEPLADQQAGHREIREHMRALICSRAADWGYEYGYFETKKWL